MPDPSWSPAPAARAGVGDEAGSRSEVGAGTIGGRGAPRVGALGGDGVMDFFTGVYWIRRAKDGSTIVIVMVPEPMDIHSMQPTITDIDGDNKADILFAVPDGRVIVYQTGMAYKAEWMQWPTNGGNIRHTGAWTPPAANRGERTSGSSSRLTRLGLWPTLATPAVRR